MSTTKRSRRPLLGREEMIRRVEQVKRLVKQGMTMQAACAEADIGSVSFYRWRQKFFPASDLKSTAKLILVDTAYEIEQLNKFIAELEAKIVSLKKKNKKLKRKS